MNMKKGMGAQTILIIIIVLIAIFILFAALINFLRLAK